MLVDNVLRNLNNNLRRLQKFQYQQSTGKVVSRPSDDPIRVTQALYMRSALSEQQQHIKNMKDAKSWLDATDTALANASEIIQRAYELAVQGANDTLTKDERNAIADEIDQLIEHLIQVANTTHTGRYIFAGSKTADVPFKYDPDSDKVIYNGNDGNLDWEVSPGVTMTINLTGKAVFQMGEDEEEDNSLFGLMIGLRKALRDNDSEGIQSSITNLQVALDHNLAQRSIAGAKSRRMELAIARAEEAEINTIELLSNLEDIDIAEVNMNLSMQSYVYQAALMTAVKVLQPSLLDFMR